MKNSTILENRLVVMAQDFAPEYRGQIERVVKNHLLSSHALADFYLILGQFGPEKILEKGSRILQKLEAKSRVRETREEEQELKENCGDYQLTEDVWHSFPAFYHPEGPQKLNYFPREKSWHEWFEGGWDALSKNGWHDLPIAGKTEVTTFFISQYLERVSS